MVCYTGDDAPASDGMFFKFVSVPAATGAACSRREAMKLLSRRPALRRPLVPAGERPERGQRHRRVDPLDMDDPEALAFTTRWIEANIVPANGGNLAQFRVPRAEDCEV